MVLIIIKINENINKKLFANDLSLDLNAKVDSFACAIKSQLRFSKMLENPISSISGRDKT